MPVSGDALRRMLLSLDGTSVGDGFGMRVLRDPSCLATRALPPAPWRWSDDTAMTVSVVENLARYGRVEQDALIAAFARRYDEEPRRGYGLAMRGLLEGVGTGPWRERAAAMFGGAGSFGNGAAMRAAPIGACFAGDLERAADEARRSAEVTHAHPEGQAGAVAVAVAAALAASGDPRARGEAWLARVLAHVPRGETRDRIEAARGIPAADAARAAAVLGTGREISAQDTVPFCLWCAAHRLGDFEDALWTTVGGLDDADTTCAIVGGIVALSVGRVPPEWLEAREALPPFETAPR